MKFGRQLIWWVGVVWLGLMPHSVLACATCFGASDSRMAQGMNMGILALLGVIGFVLMSVAAFFSFLAWRSARVHNLNATDSYL